MNKSIKEILIGTLLGDAHIRRVGVDKAYVTFEQSTKKEDYIKYLLEEVTKSPLSILKDKDNNLLREYNRQDPRSGTNTSSFYFRTESTSELNPIANMFLDQDNNKKIPSIEELKSDFTHKSLAYWIMDDGQQVKNGGVTLCTDNFKSDHIETLRKFLSESFGMFTTVHRKKNTFNPEEPYERIYISKKSLDAHKEELIPHMHTSMLYKLNIDSETFATKMIDTENSKNSSEEFKQNTKDFFDTDEDTLLGNIFEEI